MAQENYFLESLKPETIREFPAAYYKAMHGDYEAKKFIELVKTNCSPESTLGEDKKTYMRLYIEKGTYLAEIMKKLDDECSNRHEITELNKRMSYLEANVSKINCERAYEKKKLGRKDKIKEGLDVLADIAAPFASLAARNCCALNLPEEALMTVTGLAAYTTFKVLALGVGKKAEYNHSTLQGKLNIYYGQKKGKITEKYYADLKKIDHDIEAEKGMYASACISELEDAWRTYVVGDRHSSSLRIYGRFDSSSFFSMIVFKTSNKYADVTIVIMKGTELPITILVIIFLAVIVLATIMIVFSGSMGSGKDNISIEAAKSNSCQILYSTGCDEDDLLVIKVSGISGVSNLDDLCKFRFFPNDSNYKSKCMSLCGCLS